MKNGKNLVLTILSLVLVVFVGLSFLIYDKSESVSIKATTGSYAETFAKNNDLEFIEITDSENDDVAIPGTDAEDDETKVEEDTETLTVKENGTFAYNYENGKTVTIVDYKASGAAVIIPQTIDGLPVTKITFNPLDYDIELMQIPESVTTIEGEYSTGRYTAEFFASIAVMVVGYAYAIAATFLALKKANSNEKTFYGIPLIYNGVLAFVLLAIVSAVSMLLNLPIIATVVISIIIIAFTAIGLVKTTVARNAVEAVGEKVKQQTFFIKSITVDADSLMSRAQNNETKAVCKKVYEAFRYSDPMSNDQLADIENQIQNQFNAFANAVKSDDTTLATTTAEELLNLISDRNKKCKLLK